MSNTKFIIVVISLLFLAVSCKKETPEPKYAINYVAEIRDYQDDIVKVCLDVYTYFPRKDESFYAGYAKSRFVPCNYNSFFHHIYDTLYQRVDSAYSGCIYRMLVTVNRKIADHDYQTYSFLITDTIRDIYQDKTILFRFPQDSAQYRWDDPNTNADDF